MALIGLLGFGIGVASAAEPVFVPDFTPGSGDEFAVAVMLQGLVIDQLLRDGNVVLTANVVASMVGPELLPACAVRDGCPGDILPRIPSKVAVVAKIERVGGALIGNVSLFETSNKSAVDALYLPIAPGNEQNFATEVSKATQELLGKLGPSTDAVLMAAARLIAGQSIVPANPVPTPIPIDEQDLPDPAAVLPAPMPVVDLDEPGVPMVPIGRYDGSTPHTGDLTAIVAGTGVERRHLVGSEGAFRKSGLDPREWIYRAMPHAGRVTFEVRAGIGMGDVDRLADVRVESQVDEQTNAWFQEGPVPGRRARGDLFVGYAPATFLDFGVLGGLQYGRRALTTGVVLLDGAGNLVDEQVSDITNIQAVQLYLQPRVRTYLVPLGPAKPFLFTGADLRIFDKYHIDQPPTVNYLAPPGGILPGWVGGAGMLIDPGPIVGLFAEGMYIRHFGPLSESRQFQAAAGWEHKARPLADTSAITIGITGGVQFRL